MTHHLIALKQAFSRVTLAASAALVLLPHTANAQAPQIMGVHLASYHFTDAPPGRPAHNDRNPGLYARWHNGVTAGTLHNSNRDQSVYAALTWETERSHNLTLAITAGVITGYGKPLKPLLAASASLALTDNTSARLMLLPKERRKASAVAHLAVEWRF